MTIHDWILAGVGVAVLAATMALLLSDRSSRKLLRELRWHQSDRGRVHH